MSRNNTVLSSDVPDTGSPHDTRYENLQEMATRIATPSNTSEGIQSTQTRRSARVASRSSATELANRKADRKAVKDETGVAQLESGMNGIKLDPNQKRARKPKPAHQHNGEYFNALPNLADLQYCSGSQLFVWGAGGAGQLGTGIGHKGDFNKPEKNILVEEMKAKAKFGKRGAGIVAVAAGGSFSLFIDETGTIWSCGTNDNASLGRSTNNVAHPQKKNTFLDEETLTCGLHPLQSLLDEGFKAVQIAAGDSIGAAVSDAGDLRVWGTFKATDGTGSLVRHVLPVAVLELKSKPGDVEKFVDVAAGSDHVVAVTTHGNIYTWGIGGRGQLGRKVLERHRVHGTTPERVVIGARSNKAVYIGAGAYTSFAVDSESNVWGWGANNCGQTGTGFTTNGSADAELHTPRKVIGLSTAELADGNYVTKVVGGDDHTLFLTSSGKVYACGLTANGRLGISDDELSSGFLDRPALVPFPKDAFIIDISAGPRTSMAISADGILYMWGEVTRYELEPAKTVPLEVPTPVMPEGDWFATAGSCGAQHYLSLFLKHQAD